MKREPKARMRRERAHRLKMGNRWAVAGEMWRSMGASTLPVKWDGFRKVFRWMWREFCNQYFRIKEVRRQTILGGWYLVVYPLCEVYEVTDIESNPQTCPDTGYFGNHTKMDNLKKSEVCAHILQSADINHLQPTSPAETSWSRKAWPVSGNRPIPVS